MRHNSLETIEPGAFLHSELTKLFRVSFEDNNLETMDLWPFLMPSLEHTAESGPYLVVNVSFNHIYKIVNTVGFDINNLPFLKAIAEVLVIDFRRNNFQNISNVNFVKLINVKHITSLLKLWNMGFIFLDNPWRCDCEMYKLRVMFDPIIKMFKNFMDRYLISFKCEWPERAWGTEIVNTSLSNFQCQVYDLCPTDCICWHTPGNNTMNVHCNHAGMTALPTAVPPEENVQIYLQFNDIRTLEPRQYFSNVTLLDLSSNRLGMFAKHVFGTLQNVEHLILDDNDIHDIPKEFYRVNFTKLQAICLYNNPYICTCETLYLKRWIHENGDIVVHKDGIMCHKGGGSPGVELMKVPNSEFMCGAPVSLILEIYTGILGFIILQSFLITIYRRRLQIGLYFAFKKKLTMTTVSKTKNYSFDIVSIGREENYDQVEKIVRTTKRLMPKAKVWNSLETLLGTNELKETFIHMDQARCIILNISREFLLDNRSVFVFNGAFDTFIADKNVCLLPILIDVVSKHDLLGYSMDADLKYFLKKANCLLFKSQDETNFQEELCTELRKFGMIT